MSNAGIVAAMFIHNDRVYGAEIWLQNNAFLDRVLQIGLMSEDSSLWSSVQNNDIKAVQSALDRGLNPNSVMRVPCEGAKDYFANNDIHDLPNEKDVDRYIVLFDGPVSILMYAVVRSSPEIVSMLISAGADVDFVGIGRQTAFPFMLDLRKALGSEEQEQVLRIAKCLMQAGANINRVDDHGDTILLSAADNHQSRVVRLLVEKGADVNWCGRNGVSPLFHAVSNQDYELAEYLLDHDASIEAKNSHGQTALMVAAVNGYTRCLKLLLERGGNACVADADGNTALDLMEQCDWSSLDTSYCRNRENEREIQELLYKHGGHYKAHPYLNDSLERKFASASQLSLLKHKESLLETSESVSSCKLSDDSGSNLQDEMFQLACAEISDLEGYDHRSLEKIENYGNLIVERYLRRPLDVVNGYYELALAFDAASRLVIDTIADNRKIDLENRSKHTFVAQSKSVDLRIGLTVIIVLFPIKVDRVKMFIQVSSIKSTIGARKRNGNMLESIVNAFRRYFV